MKINQLFKINVPYELFIKLCNAFGFTNLSEDYTFSKLDLDRINTLEMVNNLKDELYQYYIPCKAKLYLANLDLNKCITLFRQILRLNNKALTSRQKYIKHKKITFYIIKKNNDNEDSDADNMRDNQHMVVNNDHVILSFS